MKKNKNQGEGNRDADRRYRESTRDFIEAGRVRDAANEAVNVSESERRELEKARKETGAIGSPDSDEDE